MAPTGSNYHPPCLVLVSQPVVLAWRQYTTQAPLPHILHPALSTASICPVWTTLWTTGQDSSQGSVTNTEAKQDLNTNYIL